MTAMRESGCRRGSGPQATIRACERLNSSGNGSSRSGLRVELGHRLRFLGRFLRDPNTVGAVAPSSRALAQAVCEPLRRAPRPASVLEVGAGTGPMTRYLGTILEEDDELDICEIQDDFADILERDVLTEIHFASLVAQGRIRLFRLPVQMLPNDKQYDFVISGLPLTAFELRDVEAVFDVIRRCLKPGGVFSYFEYIGLRATSRTFALGKRRARIRAVSAYLTSTLRRHRFATTVVFRNFPPAHAHHLRFDR
ncbi:MAG: methyltransferase domain-containing protein [Planctomycetota bacterium]